MYRPVQQQQVKTILFSDKNYNTLQTVLLNDFQRNGSLNEQQMDRLSKTLHHYIDEVYKVQGEKPLSLLNKEILTSSAKDFSQYMQRKEITKNTSSVKTVMDETLFQETSQRFERLTQDRNDVKALPPSMPDFRISLNEDSPPAAELFERAKKQREFEALRQNDIVKAEAGLQSRVNADSMFRTQHASQNRTTELALVQRQKPQDSSMGSNMPLANMPLANMPLAIMPDRRDLLLGPIGSFDTMSNTTNPISNIVERPIDLPQNYIVRENNVVNYREIENNLFIYSADRDWLKNNRENRYNFSVNFDPAANGQNFGPSLATQQKFKNIVRIEFVKCIMAGESLDVTIEAHSVTDSETIIFNTDYQDNILNLPYITVRVAELENNNYGTDNFLDRCFGVLQYDAQWISDKNTKWNDETTRKIHTRGYLAMIPKFLKCQKEFYPTPLSTLQKMTIDIRRPNGELVSTSPDTFDIGGIIAPYSLIPPAIIAGTGASFPFNVNLTSSYDSIDSNRNPYNFFINTTTYFSKFEICKGDRIQISGCTYPDDVLNETISEVGQTLRSFCNWINRPEGHVVIGMCYTDNVTDVKDGTNSVGYANFIVIPARYKDPSTGSVSLDSFGNISEMLNDYGSDFQTPCRIINLNKQLHIVFRIITREMDSLSQLRPDNNY